MREFVEDGEAFSTAMGRRFRRADVDNDYLLSRSELLTVFQHAHISLNSSSTSRLNDGNGLSYESDFGPFNFDKSGFIELEEFCVQMRAIFLAIADGLGFVPIEVISLDDGLLHDVVNYYHLHDTSTP